MITGLSLDLTGAVEFATYTVETVSSGYPVLNSHLP